MIIKNILISRVFFNYDPDEKLEYLTGAKEFKDDDVENKDSSVLIVGEIVTDPTKSSMTSRLGIPGPSSSLDLDTTYEEPRTIIKRNGPSNRYDWSIS